MRAYIEARLGRQAKPALVVAPNAAVAAQWRLEALGMLEERPRRSRRTYCKRVLALQQKYNHANIKGGKKGGGKSAATAKIATSLRSPTTESVSRGSKSGIAEEQALLSAMSTTTLRSDEAPQRRGEKGFTHQRCADDITRLCAAVTRDRTAPSLTSLQRGWRTTRSR